MKKMIFPALLFMMLIIPIGSLFAQWETVFFTDAGGIYTASSELEKPENPMNFGPYSPANLFDGNPDTSWVEGEDGPGIGSYVLVGLDDSLQKFLLVSNGYQKSRSLFLKNNRIKEFKVSILTGFTSDMKSGQFGFEADVDILAGPELLVLRDEMGRQQLELPFDTREIQTLRKSALSLYEKAHPEESGIRDFLILKFEITSVYEGSQWDDTCIAGIGFSNSDSEASLNPGEQISEVSISSDSQKVYIHTSEGRKLLLADARIIAGEREYTADGGFLTFTLIDVSPDNMWAVISEQHGFADGGRVEETFHLWSLQRMKEVPARLMKAYAATPMNFAIRSGRLFLETFEGKKVLLEDLDLDMDSGNW